LIAENVLKRRLTTGRENFMYNIHSIKLSIDNKCVSKDIQHLNLWGNDNGRAALGEFEGSPALTVSHS